MGQVHLCWRNVVRFVQDRVAVATTFLFWPLLAIAAIVTQADVTNAVINSPNANPYLVAHAAEIGALSLMVENTSGNTTTYNGTCCYGVLQLNTTNILASGYTVSQYQNATLQQQVNAWAQIQSQAMQHPAVASLMSMSTFDGHPVNAAMILSCIQLGQGNCATMLASGHCSGFADSNGTTICSMAAQINAAINGTTYTPGTTGGGTGSGSGVPANGGGFYTPGVINSGVTPAAAYAAGAGIPMMQTSDAIKLVVAAVALIWLGWIALGTWGQFVNGRMFMPDMVKTMGRGIVVVILIVALLN